MRVIFFKRLITLELAGCTKEHKTLKACDKNISPLGTKLKVDNFLVFTKVLKDADYECFLYEMHLTFFIQCIFKRIKLLLPYLTVLVFLFVLFESPGHWTL